MPELAQGTIPVVYNIDCHLLCVKLSLVRRSISVCGSQLQIGSDHDSNCQVTLRAKLAEDVSKGQMLYGDMRWSALRRITSLVGLGSHLSH